MEVGPLRELRRLVPGEGRARGRARARRRTRDRVRSAVLYWMREVMSARMARSRMRGVASRESSHLS